MINLELKRDLIRNSYALIDIAKEKNAEEALDKDMETIKSLFEEMQCMSSDIKSISQKYILLCKKSQIDIFLKTIDELGLSTLVSGFITLMIKSQTPHLIKEIACNWQEVKASYYNKEVVIVKSVIQLTESQKQKIISFVTSSNNKKEDEFFINYVIDPRILGGLVIKVGSKTYDSSLLNKLNQIEKSLKGIQTNE